MLENMSANTRLRQEEDQLTPTELKFYWEGALAGVDELHRDGCSIS
jgi:hypothetical protein